MKRFIKISALCFFSVFIVVVAACYLVPPLVKPVVVEKLSQALHRSVTIEKIGINPFYLSATIKGVSVREPGLEKPFVAFEELYVNAGGISSLFKRALILQEICLTRPQVSIRRDAEGGYNFMDLIPREETKEEGKKPFHFSLNNIRIIDGSIDFDDRPVGIRHTVREMNFSVPFISNISHFVDHYVEPKFTATVNGDRYEIVGKTKPFAHSRETIFDVDIREFDIPDYLDYLPVKLNCKLVSARLDTRLNVRFIMAEGKAPAVKMSGSVSLSNIQLDDLKKNSILKLPAVEIGLASVEPFVPDIHLSQVIIRTPDLVVRRDKAGTINLMNLTAPGKDRAPENRPIRPQEDKKKEAAATDKKTLKFRIDEFSVDSGKAAFIDLSPANPVRLSITPLNLQVKNLATGKENDGTVDLSLTLDNKGIVKAGGTIGLDPVRTNLLLDVKNIGIRSFLPYFAEKVKIYLTRGAVSTAGRFVFAGESGEKPSISYSGNLAVSNLATRDKAFSNDFLNWRQLYFDRIDARLNPLSLDVKGISLTDFYARVIVNPNGTLNLQNIFGTKPAGEQDQARQAEVGPAARAHAPQPPQKGTAPKIKIGKVTLQGGTIDFTDRLIRPNYSAEIHNIGGSITGLSSEEITRAAVDLKGSLGHGSPVMITGKINPLIKDLFADVKLTFKDIELSPATPYSSKYVGYPILKGKLTFDVAYLIDKQKLDAQNKIFIDQLTFGDRVESPEAIQVPVTLAVSLLTDRNGQINLDIPVTGDLNDPEFRLWPLIWKIIGNLIVKAATAPFTLLASLVGGGEELSYVEFDYGSKALTDEARHKVQTLTKALYERPNLKLEIMGCIDPEKDKEGFKLAEMNRRIKAAKLKDMLRKETADADIDQIKIEPQEYEKYLKKAYEAGKFPKPRTVIGTLKSLPAPEMEKLLLSHIEVTPSDLRLLATTRAEAVKELILKSGQVAPGRIFVVEPRLSSSQKKEKLKDSRVEFKVK